MITLLKPPTFNVDDFRPWREFHSIHSATSTQHACTCCYMLVSRVSSKKRMSFPSHMGAQWVVLISILLALSKTVTTRDHGCGASVMYNISVHYPAFAGIHCAYSRWDGQAEFIQVAAMVTCWDDLFARRRLHIPVLIGSVVEQIRWSIPIRCHYVKPPPTAKLPNNINSHIEKIHRENVVDDLQCLFSWRR